MAACDTACCGDDKHGICRLSSNAALRKYTGGLDARGFSGMQGMAGVHDTGGIGLEGRKQTLLLNTTGDYELNAGWIDTTNLAPGHYVLTLVPNSRAKVLDPVVDLSVTQPGGLVLPAESVSGPVSIEFDIGQ